MFPAPGQVQVVAVKVVAAQVVAAEAVVVVLLVDLEDPVEAKKVKVAQLIQILAPPILQTQLTKN